MAEAKRKPNVKKRPAGKTGNSEVLERSDTEAKRLVFSISIRQQILLLSLIILLC